ncbi:hypothetical protein H632_c185p1 [Helicosporidium sp. ATCC 50920]|nr:hypothetical protein H632_c185p1 [Helicosporidium sp. ATCC 50920]|eukprot:KDD76551.1 hypothetical protein H632_c185p1 [Helicosporidium sp. ATCC 50920]
MEDAAFQKFTSVAYGSHQPFPVSFFGPISTRRQVGKYFGDTDGEQVYEAARNVLDAFAAKLSTSGPFIFGSSPTSLGYIVLGGQYIQFGFDDEEFDEDGFADAFGTAKDEKPHLKDDTYELLPPGASMKEPSYDFGPKEKLYGYKKPEAAAKPKMKNVLPSNLEAAKKELKSKVCMKGWRWVGYARGVP